MSSPGSITLWLKELKQGERAVVQQLWEAYFRQMVNIARIKLQGMPDALADDEGLALSAFMSFCRAAEKNRFPRLDDRDDLWQVLLMLVRNKAADLWVRHTGKGRDFRRVVGGVEINPESQEGSILALIQSKETDPRLAVEVAEECECLLKMLPDAQSRTIAIHKMEGWTNQEIATDLGCALATVERKLVRIRRHWADKMNQ